MILNNYKKYLMGVQGFFQSGDASESLGIVALNGSENTMVVGFDSLANAVNQIRLDRNFRLALGSGATSPTADDYALSSDITSNFGSLVYSANFSVEDDSFKRTFTVSGINTSGSDKTITQIGYIKQLYYSGSNTLDVLFAVCELTNSVTVANGDSFAITLKWNDV